MGGCGLDCNGGRIFFCSLALLVSFEVVSMHCVNKMGCFPFSSSSRPPFIMITNYKKNMNLCSNSNF